MVSIFIAMFYLLMRNPLLLSLDVSMVVAAVVMLLEVEEITLFELNSFSPLYMLRKGASHCVICSPYFPTGRGPS